MPSSALRRIAPLLWVLMSLAACAAPRRDMQRPTLLVACAFDRPPFASLGPDGIPVGRDVELMRAIARGLDRVLVWRRVPADEVLEAVSGFRVQAACGVAIDDPGTEGVDLTRPTYRSSDGAQRAIALAPGEGGGELLRAMDEVLERMQASGELAELDARFGL